MEYDCNLANIRGFKAPTMVKSKKLPGPKTT